MPIRLQPRDVDDQLKSFSSVLIVACPMCPAVSMALEDKKPFIEFFKHGVKTKSFENYVKSIQERLEHGGVKTDYFTMRFPNPLMCMWTERQRGRLRKRAEGFDAVMVLGCYSAAYTARDALKGTGCRVIQGMREVSLTNVKIKYRFPMTLDLVPHALPNEFGKQQDEAPVDAVTVIKAVAS